MEVVVVVLAVAVVGLLVVKSVSRERATEWTEWPPRQHHELLLARRPDGRWEARGTRREEAALTVTLLVPWEEMGERYSGLNVVVR